MGFDTVSCHQNQVGDFLSINADFSKWHGLRNPKQIADVVGEIWKWDDPLWTLYGWNKKHHKDVYSDVDDVANLEKQ